MVLSIASGGVVWLSLTLWCHRPANSLNLASKRGIFQVLSCCSTLIQHHHHRDYHLYAMTSSSFCAQRCTEAGHEVETKNSTWQKSHHRKDWAHWDARRKSCLQLPRPQRDDHHRIMHRHQRRTLDCRCRRHLNRMKCFGWLFRPGS